MRLAIVLCFAALASVSQAGPITLQYSGSVTQVPIDDLYGDIASGAPVQLTYTFESTATDQIPADSTSASYLSSGIPFVMTLSLPGHIFTADAFVQIGILNALVDQYTVFATTASGDVTIEIFLQDNSGTVFANDSLPLAAPQLASFTLKDFHYHEIGTNGETQFDGQLADGTSVVIPEPSTAVALLTGFGALLLTRSLRRN
jgi:hypothetical protein